MKTTVKPKNQTIKAYLFLGMMTSSALILCSFEFMTSDYQPKLTQDHIEPLEADSVMVFTYVEPPKPKPQQKKMVKKRQSNVIDSVTLVNNNIDIVFSEDTLTPPVIDPNRPIDNYGGITGTNNGTETQTGQGKPGKGTGDEIIDISQLSHHPKLDGLYNYLGTAKYPPREKHLGLQGKFFVEFIVDTDGKVHSPKIIKGPVTSGFKKEIYRLIENMPKWEPAEHLGKKVKCRMRLPINFKLRP